MENIKNRAEKLLVEELETRYTRYCIYENEMMRKIR